LPKPVHPENVMKNKPGKSFVRTVTLILLLAAILPVSVFSGFWFYHDFQQYKRQTEKLITEFTTRNKKYIKDEVVAVMNLIGHEVELKKTEEITTVKAQTLEAYRIANYAQQQTKKQENRKNIQRAVIDALIFSHSQLRPTNLVILDSSGNKVLGLYGNRVLGLYSKNGSLTPLATMDKELRTVLGHNALQSEGYAHLTLKYRNQTGKPFIQTVYFKKFESLDWTFITFGNPSNVHTTLKKDLISRIKALRPIGSNYFFVADESGKLHLGPYAGDNVFKFKDLRGSMLKPGFLEIKKSGGGFIEYVLHKQRAGYKGPKLSYVAYEPTLHWYVGTGMLFEALDQALAANRQELEDKIKAFIYEGLLLLALLLVIIIAAERTMMRLFRQHLDKLADILGKAITNSDQLEDSHFYFEDNRRMVRSVNQIIQKRIRSEGELRKSELKFRTLFENLRDGFAETDMQGNLVEVNPSFCKMMGYSRVELLKLSIKDITSEKWSDFERAEVIPQVKEKGYSRIYDKEYIRKDGSVFPAEVQFYIVRDKKGRSIGIRSIIQDISRRKEAEKREFLHQKQLIQADKMISLGTLTSGVAHEINNPNQFIMTHCSLIKDTWQDAAGILEQYEEANGDFILNGLPYSVLRDKIPLFFKNIEKGTHRIQGIVGELKEFARDYPYDTVEMVDINSIVTSAITLVNHLIKKSTRHFSESYGKDLPQFWGHYQQLEQVIINLLQNACQSLSDMENKIGLDTIYQDEDNMLIVTITDEGGGIMEKDLEHITDPFFTTRRDNGGTGLGLSISDKIVREHGGTLFFSSIPGKGTTVTLSIPTEKRKNNANR